MKRGLTLGKYAPLHKGHQLVIETGLGEADEMVVVAYDAPEVTSVPLPVRAAWIRAIYPGVRVIEAWGGPSEVGYSPELRRAHERYVIDSLGVRGITHFYSSEPYGAHMGRALGAVDRRVDASRERFPVSGRQIRDDPFAFRRFVHPLVYRDLIAKVAILGAPCTGKTTLVRRLAEELSTKWMPEYGRAYWERHQVDRRLTPEQLVEVATGHLEREEALLLESNRYLLSDTNAITTETFARYYHGAVDPRLEALADQAARRYDLVFVCGADIPYEASWDRSGEGNRAELQRRLVAELSRRKVPFLTLRGPLVERVARARAVLERFEKFRNPFELVEDRQA